MKNNILGYIFIAFIIAIMGFSIYKVTKDKGDESSTENLTQTSTSQDIVKGTEMTLAISGFDTINPIITSNKKVQDCTKLIYEPLVNISSDYKLEPCLAIEWAKASSKAYVIRLKQGVKWSDGTNFTSDDVKFTIDRLKENSSSVYRENVEHVQEVDIIDNYTLRIKLTQEVNNFEYYLNFPIMSNSYYAGEDFWNTLKNSAPVTTGRFKISEVTNNTITLEKNDNWWNKKNETTTIEKITINLYSTVAELYNAFKLGGIDLILTENGSYQDYIGTIGYDTTEIEGRDFIFMAFNTSNQILSDVNVRKAIRNVINKDEIISSCYGHMYKTANFPLNTENYLIQKTEENYFNIDEKNNLLMNSNWSIRKGVWQKTENYKTIRLEFNLVVKASDSVRVKVAETIKNQLGDQGIYVNIIYAGDDQYYEFLSNKNYDMILCGYNLPIAPDLNTFFGNNNLANYYNNEVNDIMNQVKNNTNEDELKQKYQRLYEIYNEDVPYVGIARNKILAIKNTNLVGEISANWYNVFYNIKDWYTQ